ncbi:MULTISPECIES: ABC transporter substrate-binding protein [unclassified Microbacterium]|uniref:ABC transporter substrate-binding protein n=1 Tax=unclassified Microbacterium TaxID=2609290 RepID=UPI00214AAFA4|nr:MULTISPECIES: ABC transporter substrate-binding protein [unclassified Microbacterium]MCR2783607.1 ABC transporter substrate-binding protein [Microbacterium sp. zg.B96]MDL5351621.1 ABC transporter substrate-binding protein [Microbacterium sp. zg-YB36]WIM15534.1 ABC transporter substrate-binding protein [Microbacterium sp. zg-B96]
MKKKLISIAAAAGLLLGLAGCASGGGGAGGGETEGPKAVEDLVVGFAQVGAESGWRTANTKDIQSAFEEAGIELKFSDAQQKQENQIKAIRSYIQQGVDYIAFSPVVETGWDAVLNEAKAAGIPVVLTDRAVDSQDESLYVSFLGSDFIVEGEKAGQWVLEEYADTTEPVNIVQLEGTTGAAPALDRAEGFAEVISENPNLTVIASQTGDFTRAGGKQVMEAMLKSNPDIDLVYAHNDDMGLGAIEAIEAAGMVPGEDIKIVTVDAVKDGMQALADGKINFIVECSPLLGQQLVDIITTLNEGGEVEKRIITEETTFTQEQAIEALPDRQY